MPRHPRSQIVQRLNPAQLVELLNSFGDTSLSEEQIERNLLVFCLNCPDPGGAMDVVLEAKRGTSDEEITARALTLAPRSVKTWSHDELSEDHPLRHWKLEE
jgi:hypothetical protein